MGVLPHFETFPIYLPQVVIEGVVGVTFASNIAVDDFNFRKNLTCVSVGKPTPPETFEGIDFLTGGYFRVCARGNPDRKNQGRILQSNRILREFLRGFVFFFSEVFCLYCLSLSFEFE